MTRTKSTERMNLSYERIVERTSDDEPERDPSPSFPPMRVVVPAEGETVAEVTIPLPLVKCSRVCGIKKVG